MRCVGQASFRNEVRADYGILFSHIGPDNPSSSPKRCADSGPYLCPEWTSLRRARRHVSDLAKVRHEFNQICGFPSSVPPSSQLMLQDIPHRAPPQSSNMSQPSRLGHTRTLELPGGRLTRFQECRRRARVRSASCLSARKVLSLPCVCLLFSPIPLVVFASPLHWLSVASRLLVCCSFGLLYQLFTSLCALLFEVLGGSGLRCLRMCIFQSRCRKS